MRDCRSLWEHWWPLALGPEKHSYPGNPETQTASLPGKDDSYHLASIKSHPANSALLSQWTEILSSLSTVRTFGSQFLELPSVFSVAMHLLMLCPLKCVWGGCYLRCPTWNALFQRVEGLEKSINHLLPLATQHIDIHVWQLAMPFPTLLTFC